MRLAVEVSMEGFDFNAVFLPQAPLLEIFVRGSAMYLALFVLLRFVVKREAGSLGVTDLLVIVLIADAAQNGMAGDYRSISDGLLLVGTIVGWSYVLDALAFRFPLWRRILRPAPVQLIRDGRVLQEGLKREKITEEELLGEVRNHGCNSAEEVRSAYIESDGMISVITFNGKPGGHPRSKKGGPTGH